MVASPASAGQVLLEHQQQPQSQPQNSQARALSEKPNAENAPRRPRAREITSRYKSSSSSPAPPPSAIATPPPSSSSSSSSGRRFPSPIIGRSFSGSDGAKRASSVERRRSDSPSGKSSPSLSSSSGNTSTSSASRPVTPRSTIGETLRGSSTQRLWPSTATHNLSTSLQLDHTLKPAENGIRRGSSLPSDTSACNRKGTPERKRTPSRRPTDQAENAKPLDNSQRWPGGNSPKSLSRSMDLSSEKEKSGRLAGLMVQGRAMNGSTRPVRRTPPIRSLSRSINEGPLPDSPQSVSRHMISESRGRGAREGLEDETESTVSEGQPSSLDNMSDTESLSSAGSIATGRKISSSATRPRRLDAMVGSSLSEQEFASAIKGGRRLKSLSLSGGSPSAAGLSPGRMSTASQPPSPSRTLISSPFRSMPSPTRTRVPTFQLPPSGFNSRASLSSLLHLPELRKGKKAMSQQEEAQYLRILHNRWLQWCFVNARAESARTCQKAIAERSIYNAWLQTSELRKSVAMKRIKLQQARQVRKLHSILSSQGPQLETWAGLQQEHSVALSGAMEALEAAVLRVPVTAGARADVQGIRDALVCAVDVMGSVESSVGSLLPKTHNMDALVCELAEVAKQEKSILEECNGLLDRIAALEIEERSLRTHFVQLECEKSRDWIPVRSSPPSPSPTTTTTPAKPC